MTENLLECSNCEGYDDGGCLEMSLGMVPEQCQVFDPIATMGIYKKTINLRGMVILTTLEVMSKPDHINSLSDEELKGLHINLKA